MKTHYIVIRAPLCRDHLPTTEHETYEAARAEAERLAGKHPQSTFRVYRLAEEWAAIVTVNRMEAV